MPQIFTFYQITTTKNYKNSKMEIIKVDQMASKVVDLPQLSLEEIFSEFNSEFSTDIFNYQIKNYENSHISSPYYDPYNTGIYDSCQPYGYQSPSYPSSPEYLPSEQNGGYVRQLLCGSPSWEPKMKTPKSYHCQQQIKNDLTMEEIEKIRIEFKQKRIRLGLSQKQAAASVSQSVRKTSQTSLCRFENNQLHKKNMISLASHLKKWIQIQK